MHIWKKRKAVAATEISLSSRDKDDEYTVGATASQMDAIVTNMLGIITSKGIKALFQGGDPVTSSGKRFQMLHVMGLTLVPVLVLLGLSGALFSIRVRDHLNNREIWKVLEHGVEISELIHNLQQERDLTCLYLSAISPKTKEFLLDLYPETDHSLDVIRDWDPMLSAEASGNAPEFYSKALLKIHLGRHRYQIENGHGSTTKKELDFYSRLIDILIGRFLTAVSDVDVGNSWRQLVAIQETVTAKESFGIERAYGTIFFTSGGFQDRGDYLTFVEAQDVANASLDNARFYSDEVVNAMYVNITSDNKEFVATIRKMRHYIRNNMATKVNGSWTQGRWWFNNMTNYLDILLLVQRNLTRLIEDTLDDQQANEKTMLIVLGTVFVIIGFVCPLILQSVYVATSDIQGYYISLVDRIKGINREKHKTDLLLYRLLPKPVAEQLKQNRTVVAKAFSDVTVFFSDIVGFTGIISASSPIQVVDLLDTLHTEFEERIKLYKVYKVETIGDAYMVVSGESLDKEILCNLTVFNALKWWKEPFNHSQGLPLSPLDHEHVLMTDASRHGSGQFWTTIGLNKKTECEHPSEICSMALDILDHIQVLEVPGHPEKDFRVRIGCHTGAVVAGVVGNKMPRYCLFGETVTLANKLETTAIAGAIQISNTTYKALEKYGVFVMERRHNPPKGINFPTYWLTHKVGMARIKLSPPLDSQPDCFLALPQTPDNVTSSTETGFRTGFPCEYQDKTKTGKADCKKSSGKEKQKKVKTKITGNKEGKADCTKSSGKEKQKKVQTKIKGNIEVTGDPEKSAIKEKQQKILTKRNVYTECTFDESGRGHAKNPNTRVLEASTSDWNSDETDQEGDFIPSPQSSIRDFDEDNGGVDDISGGVHHKVYQDIVTSEGSSTSDVLSDEDDNNIPPRPKTSLSRHGKEGIPGIQIDSITPIQSDPEVRLMTKPYFYTLPPPFSDDSGTTLKHIEEPEKKTESKEKD